MNAKKIETSPIREIAYSASCSFDFLVRSPVQLNYSIEKNVLVLHGKTTKVLLNVYDLSETNHYLFPVGIGLHHSGVEIAGREYSYASQGGIYESPPEQAAGARFRCQLEMGAYDGGLEVLNKALDELRHNGGFGGNDYNLIRKNCNHFCNALVWLLLHRPIPSYVNRLANIGDCCSCLLPRELLNDSPVGGSMANNQSSFHAPSGALVDRGRGGSHERSAFTGRGYSLGGSSTSFSLVAQPDLTDRRERARKAALSRLEQQSHSSES